MSHYAKVENGLVTQVIVADENFINALPDAQSWIQTSYNTRGGVHYAPDSNNPDGGIALRANYAGVGYVYDAKNDVFYEPQPYPSWTISEPTWTWNPPTPYPLDGKKYVWNEDTKSWDELVLA